MNDKTYILTGSQIEQIKKDTINKFVSVIEETDNDEFAMFSLGFIKEVAEQLIEIDSVTYGHLTNDCRRFHL